MRCGEVSVDYQRASIGPSADADPGQACDEKKHPCSGCTLAFRTVASTTAHADNSSVDVATESGAGHQLERPTLHQFSVHVCSIVENTPMLTSARVSSVFMTSSNSPANPRGRDKATTTRTSVGSAWRSFSAVCNAWWSRYAVT
jgi:hypothetical protein